MVPHQLQHTVGENRTTDNFHRTHREEGCVNYYRVRFDRRDDWFDAACRCQVAAEGDDGFEPSWMFDRLTSYGARGGAESREPTCVRRSRCSAWSLSG